MIELRWLVFGSGPRVLQSRIKYDKTVYALPAGVKPLNPHTETVWSEWSDIPQYLCGFDENGERKVMDRAL
jgi:hypothetical protein